MKKFLLSCLLILTFSAYVIIERLNSTKQTALATTLPAVATNQFSSSPSVSNSYSSANASTSNTQSNTYKDGQFTGSTADAYYGSVQVKATIKNGKIVDVQFLDYPHDRSTSVAINNQAMPYLKQEAIQAQSAQVDIVSGATLTSEAFRQSLQDALSQAV